MVQLKYIGGKYCPYCDKPTEYVDSKIIYGKSYGMVYMCTPCKAWVGTHKSDNTQALGRLADSQLREAKKTAHEHFDKLWKNGKFERNEAYKKLSNYLNIEGDLCHIGMFDVEGCRKVVEFSKIHFKNK
jgi:hypothetical protein